VNPDTLDQEEMQQYKREIGIEEVMSRVLRTLTPGLACDVVRNSRPVVLRRICTALADKLMEGLAPKYLDPDYDPWTDPEFDDAAPSPNGENGVRQESDVAVEEAGGTAALRQSAPSPTEDNGGKTRAAAGHANGGNGSKGTKETGRDNPAAPQPRRQPETRGPSKPSAAAERRSNKPGGAPPRG
jgi:hypothetical protein